MAKRTNNIEDNRSIGDNPVGAEDNKSNETPTEPTATPGLGTGRPSTGTGTAPVRASVGNREAAAGVTGDAPEFALAGHQTDDKNAGETNDKSIEEVRSDAQARAEDLQKQYDAILEKSSAFDRETQDFQKGQTKAAADFLAQRRVERSQILKEKARIASELETARREAVVPDSEQGKLGS